MPFRRLPSLLALVVSLSLTLGGPASADSVVRLGDDPRLAELEVTTFAARLNFPTGMVELPEGSILVATSAPTGGSFFTSTGELLRLTDEDADGAADDAGTILATGLPGTLVSLALAGDLVLTTSAEGGNEQIVVLRRGDTWADPLEPAGSLRFILQGFNHQSYGLAVRESPNVTGRYEVVFNIGASGNDTSGRIAYTQGLAETQLRDASLYRMTITDNGGKVTAAAPEQIASGLRNAAAIIFDPGSGDLLITDNGIDTPEDRVVALSADELYRLPAHEIGGEIEDYGFPAAYVDYATGDPVGDQVIGPEVAYRPIDGSEAEGVASVAVAPDGFPDELQGVVAGFHGQYDDIGVANEENPLLLTVTATDETVELIANADPTIGHIDGLTTTATTLYAADLCSGLLTEPEACGTIYAVRVADSGAEQPKPADTSPGAEIDVPRTPPPPSVRRCAPRRASARPTGMLRSWTPPRSPSPASSSRPRSPPPRPSRPWSICSCRATTSSRPRRRSGRRASSPAVSASAPGPTG